MKEIIIQPLARKHINAVANIWHDGWHDAHAALVPGELTAIRTMEAFGARVTDELHMIRVAGPVGAPIGMCIRKGNELYQLYVAPAGRGTGLAGNLMQDAEAAMAASGVDMAWLGCAIGNTRAARFYEKQGWQLAREDVVELVGSDAPFPLNLWVYEKSLG